MAPEDALRIANAETTPKFFFGSRELEDWNAEHRYNGDCVKHSGWYVVIHRSLIPNLPDFRVLCCWCYGMRTPTSVDLPA